MSGVVVLTPGAKVGIVSERLRIEQPPNPDSKERLETEIPLVDVEYLMIGNHVALSSPALADLLEREIPVLVINAGTRLSGICLPPPRLTLARFAQFQKMNDPSWVRDFAVELVRAKILNQRRVLQRLSANRTDVAVGETLRTLAELSERLDTLRPGQIEELMGHEGIAARHYFAALAQFFPPHAPMKGRTRQPPGDPPNAILSYAYTVMLGEMITHLHAVGLDPALGYFHAPEERRAALALDLIEPFRPVIGDALALDLLSHGILHPEDHFESRDGGVFLNLEGRKKFHLAYARRLDRSFRYKEVTTTLRSAMRDAAMDTKLYIVGERACFRAFRMP